VDGGREAECENGCDQDDGAEYEWHVWTDQKIALCYVKTRDLIWSRGTYLKTCNECLSFLLVAKDVAVLLWIAVVL